MAHFSIVIWHTFPLQKTQDRSDEAEPLLQHIVAIREKALGPDHLHTAQSLNELAGFYLSQKKYEQAEPLIKRALAICEQKMGPMHPYLAEFLLNLAKLYLGQDQYQKAEDVIKQVLAVLEQEQEGDLDSRYSREHKRVSLLCVVIGMYMQQSKYEQAESLVKQVLRTWGQAHELEPLTADACNYLGDIYIEQGKYEEAEQLYKRALNIWEQIMGPGDRYRMNSLDGLARIYTKQGKFEQAISVYNRTISLSPNYAEAYHGRGYMYLHLKKSEEASADFAKCADLQPGNVSAAWMAVYAAFSKQRPGADIAERLEAIALPDPESEEACVCRGVALGLRSKPQEGLGELEQALSLDAENEDALFWKGMMCAYLGRSTEAMESIEQALQGSVPPLLLTPLFWLEQESPHFYREYAESLLKQYELL